MRTSSSPKIGYVEVHHHSESLDACRATSLLSSRIERIFWATIRAAYHYPRSTLADLHDARRATGAPAALLRRRVARRPLSGAASASGAAELARDGFTLAGKVLSDEEVRRTRDRYEALFRGSFDTGIYPDEWHWREGISRPEAVREIVNGWKADSQVAEIVRSAKLGKLAADLMGWKAGARLAQDDVLWKPPLAGGVAFHQDAAYISTQFQPYQDNSVTIWIALDDADHETGVVEYCPGSHRWPLDAAKGASAVDSAFHGHADHLEPLAQAARAAGRDPSKLSVKSLPVRAGEAIVHHQDVWHGSAANISSTRHRRALAIHLVRADVAWRDSPRPDYIYGRYFIPQEPRPRDDFFPVTYTP